MRPIAAPAIQPAGSVSCRVDRARASSRPTASRVHGLRATRGAVHSDEQQHDRSARDASRLSWHTVRRLFLALLRRASTLSRASAGHRAGPALRHEHARAHRADGRQDDRARRRRRPPRRTDGTSSSRAARAASTGTTTDAWRDEAKRTQRDDLRVAGLRAGVGQRRPAVPLSAAELSGLVRLRLRDRLALSRRHPSCGASGTSRTSTSTCRAPIRSVYRSLVITARAAIRAADPLAMVLGPDVSWHGVKDGWFAAVMNDFGDLFDIVTVHWYADGPDLALMMDQLVRPVSLGKTGLDERGRDEAVRVAVRRGGAGAALSAGAERVPGAAQLVDRRALLRSLRAARRRATAARRSRAPTGRTVRRSTLYQAFIKAHP